MTTALLLVGMTTAFDWTEQPLPFTNYCEWLPIPGMDWYESYSSNLIGQDYCWSYDNSTLYIRQEPLYAGSTPFTAANTDVWTEANYEKNTGNIREVVIAFEYYAPSMDDGTCLHTSINGNTGLYNSPQLILITNKESNLSIEGTFNDAYIQFNDEIQCDEWRLFTHRILDFTNDYGSSFSGQSKSIGSIGFEAKNIYIRELMILDRETVEVVI